MTFDIEYKPRNTKESYFHQDASTKCFYSFIFVLQTDTFVVQAVDLGRLMQIQIGHGGQGPGSGWYLKTVTVKESMEAQEKYIFKCEQ